jgi:hypothetical protein
MRDDLRKLICEGMWELTPDEIRNVTGGIFENGVGPTVLRVHVKIINGYANQTFEWV